MSTPTTTRPWSLDLNRDPDGILGCDYTVSVLADHVAGEVVDSNARHAYARRGGGAPPMPGENARVAIPLNPTEARAKAAALLAAANEVDPPSDETPHPTSDPIHGWFGLSYANYLVAPRARLQSMPVEWQERMVACLEELDAAYAYLSRQEPFDSGYNVQAGRWVYVNELDDHGRALTGVSISEDTVGREDEPLYYDVDGNELAGHDRVFVPGEDPNPHYNRGRTYLPPFGGDQP